MRFLPLLLAALLVARPVLGETFKVATALPDGTGWMEAIRAGADEVARQTDGRVRFRFYPGGVMGDDQSVLRKIRIGQLHGGALTGGGLAMIHSDAQVYGLPFLFRDLQEVDYVRKRVDPVLVEAIEANGFVSFGFSESGFAYMMSGTPIRTVDDLKGRKLWIPDGDEVSQTAIAAFKVNPVSLPLTDVLTGLQTGLVDTVATSPIGAIAFQWHTRIHYVSDYPLSYLFAGMVLDGKRFSRLSPADQAVTREVMGAVFAKLDRENRQANQEARAALVAQGIEFIQPTPQEETGWREGVRAAVERLADRGVFGRGLLRTVESHLDAYRNGLAAH